MGFDLENFGVGLLAGWASAYGVYRGRHRILAVLQLAGRQASSAQNFATRSADNRYVDGVTKLAQASHLASDLFNLTDILIEPRFIPALPLAAPLDDDVTHSVYHIVPIIPDLPYLHAPYHVDALTIDDLNYGERSLAIIGRPGSGRTTALWAILLRSLGRVQFYQPPDLVQQRLDAEEAALSEKQRAVRVKDRLMMEQRAREKLAEAQGMSYETQGGSETVPVLNRLMPVYVHLGDVRLTTAELGAEADPAEPLVRAVQGQLGRVAASTIPRSIYFRLTKGQVLLLVDGYDDVPEAERSRLLSWLQALKTQYPENFFVVAAPATGYGLLTQRLGLTPLYLRPWSDGDARNAVERWADAWSKLGTGKKLRQARPEDAVIERARTNNRTFSPLDLTLKIWANFAGDTELAGYAGWMQALIARWKPKDQQADLFLPLLAKLASSQINEGYVTEATVVAASVEEGTAEPEVPESTTKRSGKGRADNAKAQPVTKAGRLLSSLEGSGLLIQRGEGRYQLRHPSITAYLASLTLKEADDAVIAEHARKPAWRTALGMAALHRPVDEAVRVLLNTADDVLYSTTFSLARWLSNAGTDAGWRVSYLKQVANMLLAPSQYPLIRERAASALVATRDESVLRVMKQGLQHSDPQVRRICSLAIGALGREEGVKDLQPILKDKDADVELAAVLAIGAIPGEEALNATIETLAEGTERLRQAAAETLADNPRDGYAVLNEAIQDQDMMLRRAAVFGLRRIRSNWALLAIYRAFLEDEQWYVRSAAQLAFFEFQSEIGRGPSSHPPAEAIEWLNKWAASKGENVPPGEAARQMLLKALQAGEPEIRCYSALNLGQIGAAAMAKSLYGALRDQSPEVREAAHRALGELQLQMGARLPAPQ